MGKIPTDATSNNKPIIVLDLDETLISSVPSKKYKNKHEKKAKQFEFENMDDYYIVFSRPGLQNFLDYLFANFTVSVWTAATKDYAVFVTDKILTQGKPERRIDMIFFSYHCDMSKKMKKGTKDLTMLWDVFELEGYNSKNVIMFDDLPEVHTTNPSNHIKVKAFKFTDADSENDTFLKDIQPELDKVKEHVKSGGSDPGLVVATLEK